ncbi:methylaspartate ammonia-lyase [Altererythrobacter sp. GH1-8]|uniref:methylaspartate ammonia-lyase n=1 Tax=Altererythrobacter sp. GH1-8 TaxID=3349333 RepID=UPI00374CFDBA
MQIVDVLFAPTNGAFFYDDQAAIREGREHDGVAYLGEPVTQGFTSVRQPSKALSIGLMLDDGSVSWGDMVSVQYSGAAGRDPLFDQERIESFCREVMVSRLRGLDLVEGAKLCDEVMRYHDGKRLPLAVEYGVSQAFLKAAAYARKLTLAEVIAEWLGLAAPTEAVPIFAQSGDDRRNAVDTMILKQVDVLPHGLINSAEKFGRAGETFADYVSWVAQRIAQLGAEGYKPVLHFDVYGWIGLGVGTDPRAIAEYIARVAERVPSYTLNIECPADYGTRAAQIDNYAAIVEHVNQLADNARVVADEHCNTLDDIEAFIQARAAHVIQVKTPDVGNLLDTARAIIAAREAGIGAYSGGTSAETDESARACVHVALASRATMMLAKPGMGVNEGITIVGNEQARTLATIRTRLSRELSDAG